MSSQFQVTLMTFPSADDDDGDDDVCWEFGGGINIWCHLFDFDVRKWDSIEGNDVTAQLRHDATTQSAHLLFFPIENSSSSPRRWE